MWKLSVTTTSEAEDAVAELLGGLFGQSATAHTDFKNGKTTVAVYCRRKPTKLADLRQRLAQIRECGLDIGPGRATLQKLKRENWAESWKRHFKPIEIGDALLVKPSWSKRHPRKNQAVMVLDPGLSFGTGNHPTTLFCLREIARWRGIENRAFLDLGTGSGILAIAAAKLGYAPVHAIDFDPESLRAARDNARVNGVSKRIRIARRDLTKIPLRSAQKYDLICANLLSTLLNAERKRIFHRLKSGGALVVAGILRSEFELVAKSYRRLGLKLIASKSQGEWRSGTFVR